MDWKQWKLTHPLTETHTLDGNTEAVTRLRDGKAATVHSISSELLKGGGAALFNTSMDWASGKGVVQGHNGKSIGNTKVTDLVIADEAVTLPAALEAMPLGPNISWATIKVQNFGGQVDGTVPSCHTCGEDSEPPSVILQTYIESDLTTPAGMRKRALKVWTESIPSHIRHTEEALQPGRPLMEALVGSFQTEASFRTWPC